jgi:hypothetical protein
MTDQMLQEKDPHFICGVGHGNPNVYTGQNQEVLFDRSVETAMKLKGRSASFLSCSWGQAARDLVDLGMACFHGYIVDFYFVSAVPPDSFATPFMRAHLSYSVALFEGKTRREAYAICIDTWNKEIAEMDALSARYAIEDRDGTVVEGDLDVADFPPYEPPPPKFTCCKCGVTCWSCDDLIDHILEQHVLPEEREKRSWFCKWLGGLLGCPLGVSS